MRWANSVFQGHARVHGCALRRYLGTLQFRARMRACVRARRGPRVLFAQIIHGDES